MILLDRISELNLSVALGQVGLGLVRFLSARRPTESSNRLMENTDGLCTHSRRHSKVQTIGHDRYVHSAEIDNVKCGLTRQGET